MLNPKRRAQLEELLSNLNIGQVPDLELVSQALTHPSYLYEGGGGDDHNQRLEFLGDAVVGLVVTHYLYKKHPRKSEGELTKTRAAVVCEASLAQSARALNLGAYLQMGKGEGNMGGAARASNLADCFEALMGALYLSQGLEKVSKVIINSLSDQISKASRGKYGDYKTQLQEFVQKIPDQRISYQIIKEEGPDHDKVFQAGIYLNDRQIARGIGHTKKEAEQQAAKQALHNLGAG